MSNLKLNDNGELLETDCTISFEGRSFTSSGAYLSVNPKTGKLHGILYLHYSKDIAHKDVGTWDGSKKTPCTLTNTWRGSFDDTRNYFLFEWDGREFSGIQYGDSDIVHVRERSTECLTQHDAATLWAKWMRGEKPDECPEFRAGGIHANGRELMHYSTVQEWRTLDGLLIGNSDCWAGGWAHCSTAEANDWLSLEALKAEGIDHLSLRGAGADENGRDCYFAIRGVKVDFSNKKEAFKILKNTKPICFRETEYMDDTEFNSGRRVKWLEYREGDKWVHVRAIRRTGRDHLSMSENEARLWFKRLGERRAGYFKGLRNKCREVIPTKKNFEALGVEVIERANDDTDAGVMTFIRRTLTGRPGLYHFHGTELRIVETWTTVHNPRAFVWKVAALNKGGFDGLDDGMPVRVGLFGKDESGQLWFYEFPRRFDPPRPIGTARRPFGVDSVQASIVVMERALLGMTENDVLVSEA